jgi:hypothetical protein
MPGGPRRRSERQASDSLTIGAARAGGRLSRNRYMGLARNAVGGRAGRRAERELAELAARAELVDARRVGRWRALFLTIARACVEPGGAFLAGYCSALPPC